MYNKNTICTTTKWDNKLCILACWSYSGQNAQNIQMVVQVVFIELENVYYYYIIYTYDMKYVSSWIKNTVCSWKSFCVLLISTLFALQPTQLLLRFICLLYTSRIINLQQIPITSTNFKVNNKEQEVRYRKCSISEFTDLSILFQYRDSLTL